MSLDQVNNLIFVLTVLGQIFIVAAIIYLIFFRKIKNKLINFLTKNTIALAFLVALFSTSASLYYSGIAGFIPCDLCWLQRIFLFPLVIILGLAWLKKKDEAIDYSLALISIGTIISVYHNYIYYTAVSSTFCSITSPCTQVYVTGYNYLSLPLMSLTAFLMIGLLLLNKKFNK